MTCDYYIKIEIIVHYMDNKNTPNNCCISESLMRGYIFDYDIDDRSEHHIKQQYKAELEQAIQENTHEKALFKNNHWLKDCYKTKYDEKLHAIPNVNNVTTIYKKTSAWERN